MKLKYRQTLQAVKASNLDGGSLYRSTLQQAKVTALSHSPDNQRLAVATADRLITIYDEKYKQVDKFNTKPNGKGPKTYTIR